MKKRMLLGIFIFILLTSLVLAEIDQTTCGQTYGPEAWFNGYCCRPELLGTTINSNTYLCTISNSVYDWIQASSGAIEPDPNIAEREAFIAKSYDGLTWTSCTHSKIGIITPNKVLCTINGLGYPDLKEASGSDIPYVFLNSKYAYAGAPVLILNTHTLTTNDKDWYICAAAANPASNAIKLTHGQKIPYDINSDVITKFLAGKAPEEHPMVITSYEHAFICYKEGTKSLFGECNSDLTLKEDYNSHLNNLVSADFQEGVADNQVYNRGEMLYFINKDFLSKKSLTITVPDLALKIPVRDNLKSWTSFNFLEFDINFTEYPEKIKIYNSNDELIFEDYLHEYATTPWKKNRWQHVKLDITQFSRSDVKEIRIYADYESIPTTMEIQDLFLKSGAYYYCTWPNIWISEMEPDANKVNVIDVNRNNKLTDLEDMLPFKEACNSVNSFLWTGSKCCGDDASELYADSEHGCWENYPVKNATSVSDATGIEGEKDLIFTSTVAQGSFKACKSKPNKNDLSFINSEYCEVIGEYFCSRGEQVYEEEEDDYWSKEPDKSGIPSNQRNTEKSSPPGKNLLTNPEMVATCDDGIQNQNEVAIDCGATCEECTLGCGFKDQCKSSETEILHISELKNAHAELNYMNNYRHKLCCSFGGGALTVTEQTGETGLIALDAETNAFVQDISITDAAIKYAKQIYLNLNPGHLECSLKEEACFPDNCLFSLSDKEPDKPYTNLHIGDCGAYNTKMCCGFRSD
ncbi:hypothetical protein KY330_00665 [Candidatus Woesearchaeota archaeon]|nr:hypothetical protein [Candidatus Woesearchaeota archaeon]